MNFDAEIREAIAEVARREFGLGAGLPAGELAAYMDSLARLRFVVAIEDRFGIALEPEDDAEVRTVDDLVRVIRRKTTHGG
jgi:acyl carrier protein